MVHPEDRARVHAANQAGYRRHAAAGLAERARNAVVLTKDLCFAMHTGVIELCCQPVIDLSFSASRRDVIQWAVQG